jgi:hypothetical protein
MAIFNSNPFGSNHQGSNHWKEFLGLQGAILVLQEAGKTSCQHQIWMTNDINNPGRFMQDGQTVKKNHWIFMDFDYA